MKKILKRLFSSRKHNDLGQELMDPTPMQVPIGFRHPPSLHDRIRALVRSERLALELDSKGIETFDEAEDFDVGDDYDPSSPYEEQFEGDFKSQKELEKEFQKTRQPAKKKFVEEKPVEQKAKVSKKQDDSSAQ